MKFFEFAKILKPIVAGNSNAANFVIKLFKAITEFTDDINPDSYLEIMPSFKNKKIYRASKFWKLYK